MKNLFAMALAVLLPVCASRAELLIYDLSFGNTGPSVNYSFLQGGYLIVDVASNAVTSIVTLTDPETNLLYYTTGLLTGTYMELISEGIHISITRAPVFDSEIDADCRIPPQDPTSAVSHQ